MPSILWLWSFPDPSCEKLVTLERPGPFYGLMMFDHYAVFSDWFKHSIQMLNLDTGHAFPIASNLMRPTQFTLRDSTNLYGNHPAIWPYHSEMPIIIITWLYVGSTDYCTMGLHACSQQCLPYPGGFQCACSQGNLSPDGYTCYDSNGKSTLGCNNANTLLRYLIPYMLSIWPCLLHILARLISMLEWAFFSLWSIWSVGLHTLLWLSIVELKLAFSDFFSVDGFTWLYWLTPDFFGPLWDYSWGYFVAFINIQPWWL